MRVVEHLLGYNPGLQVVARVEEGTGLVRTVNSALPDIAIISERLMGEGLRQAISEIRQASPQTKVLVIRAWWEFATANREWGADAYVREQALVRRLHGLLSRLSSGPPCTVH